MKSWKLTHFTFILVHFLPATKTSLGPGSFLTNNFFFISNFRRALNVVCFLLGDSPASEFYIPTFRNILFHLHRQVGVKNELVLRNVGLFIWVVTLHSLFL